MGNILDTPDYFGDAWNRVQQNFANSPEGQRIALEARGWKRMPHFSTQPIGAGGRKSFEEETWTSPDSETTIVGPDALQQAMQYSQKYPVKDASQTIFNDLMAGGAGLWRGIGNGVFQLAQKWLPKLSFSSASTAGKGLGATASNAALWGDAAFAVGTSVPTIMDISQNGLNPVNATEMGLSLLPVAGQLPGMWNNFRNRWTPQGFRIGNNAYGFNFGQLNSGMPISKTPLWQLEQLPGYHIKSTTTGSPLEKQLSKNGTLSLKQLQAYVGRNDVSAIDKELLGRVLQDHAGDTHIDYNTLRREIQGMIPQYNKISQTSYQNYGIESLGFSKAPAKRFGRRQLFDEYDFMHTDEIPFQDVSFNTFTYESPGIKGNTKHYGGNPIGHSRTYTTADEPDILHVMESQSDWAQTKPFTVNKNYVDQFLKNYSSTRQSILDEISELQWKLDNNRLSRNSKISVELNPNNRNIFKQLLDKKLKALEKLDSYYEQYTAYPNIVDKHMRETYLNRQLQENLKYAAENGQTKMRYPTSETAAKIEGYKKESIPLPTPRKDRLHEIERQMDEIQSKGYINGEFNDILWKENITDNPEYWKLFDEHRDIIDSFKLNPEPIQKLEYSPQHQTILKKYSDFTKQFQKLFGKQTPIRTVTDAKGNTWYEVDVPENYLNGTAEMLFKKGGRLKLIPKAKSGIHIKEENKGKFTKSAKQAGQSVQEHAKSVLNNPNATPLQKKRANFARNAKAWSKK